MNIIIRTKIEDELSKTFTWKLISPTAQEELVEAFNRLICSVQFEPISILHDDNPDDVALLGLRQ